MTTSTNTKHGDKHHEVTVKKYSHIGCEYATLSTLLNKMIRDTLISYLLTSLCTLLQTNALLPNVG